MGLCCCDRCWERPCVCGYEREQGEKFRREYYADLARYLAEEEAAEIDWESMKPPSQIFGR